MAERRTRLARELAVILADTDVLIDYLAGASPVSEMISAMADSLIAGIALTHGLPLFPGTGSISVASPASSLSMLKDRREPPLQGLYLHREHG